jgi:hypothetical protein
MMPSRFRDEIPVLPRWASGSGVKLEEMSWEERFMAAWQALSKMECRAETAEALARKLAENRPIGRFFLAHGKTAQAARAPAPLPRKHVSTT